MIQKIPVSYKQTPCYMHSLWILSFTEYMTSWTQVMWHVLHVIYIYIYDNVVCTVRQSLDILQLASVSCNNNCTVLSIYYQAKPHVALIYHVISSSNIIKDNTMCFSSIENKIKGAFTILAYILPILFCLTVDFFVINATSRDICLNWFNVK